MIFYILDRNEELRAVLSNDSPTNPTILRAVINEKINDLYTLNMEVSGKIEESQHLKEENYILFKDNNSEWQLYVIKEVTETHGEDFTKTIYSEHASQELIDELCTTELNGTSGTIADTMEVLLGATRWTTANFTSNSNIVIPADVTTANKSILEVLEIIRSNTGKSIKYSFTVVGNSITKRTVLMADTIGNDYGKRFEYTKDITSIERAVSTTDIKTAIKPIGKDGLTISDVVWTTPTNPLNKALNETVLVDTSATNDWGFGTLGNKRPRTAFYENSEIETADALIVEAYNVLQTINKPKITYTLDVVDLYALTGDKDYSFESVKIGDIVIVIDLEFTPSVRIKSTIIEREVDLLAPDNNRVTLGNYRETTSDFSNSIAEKVDNISLETLSNGFYKDIASQNQQDFLEGRGFIYMSPTDGLWTYDKPVGEEPTKVLVLKGGMLGIGNWNTQTQQWDITTFIDGDSVSADNINSGSMSSERIYGGSLTSLNGTTHINLDNGTFNFANRMILDADGTFTFNMADTEIANALNDLTTVTTGALDTITATTEALDVLSDKVDENQSKLTKHIRFVNGNIVLGDINSELTLKIQNERISFITGVDEEGVDIEVAYFSSNKLYVTDIAVKDELSIGGFAFVPRANGNLSFRKV